MLLGASWCSWGTEIGLPQHGAGVGRDTSPRPTGHGPGRLETKLVKRKANASRQWTQSHRPRGPVGKAWDWWRPACSQTLASNEACCSSFVAGGPCRNAPRVISGNLFAAMRSDSNQRYHPMVSRVVVQAREPTLERRNPKGFPFASTRAGRISTPSASHRPAKAASLRLKRSINSTRGDGTVPTAACPARDGQGNFAVKGASAR